MCRAFGGPQENPPAVSCLTGSGRDRCASIEVEMAHADRSVRVDDGELRLLPSVESQVEGQQDPYCSLIRGGGAKPQPCVPSGSEGTAPGRLGRSKRLLFWGRLLHRQPAGSSSETCLRTSSAILCDGGTSRITSNGPTGDQPDLVGLWWLWWMDRVGHVCENFGAGDLTRFPWLMGPKQPLLNRS